MRLIVFAILTLTIVGCDTRPSTTMRVLGAEREPDWSQEECTPPTLRAVLGVPSDRYWYCDASHLDASATVDWWRERAVAGHRRWFMRDSASWLRFRDSTAQALATVATSRRCTDRDMPDRVSLDWEELQLWTFTGERRWVTVGAYWSPQPAGWQHAPGEGIVAIKTDTGHFDSCAAYLRMEMAGSLR